MARTSRAFPQQPITAGQRQALTAAPPPVTPPPRTTLVIQASPSSAERSWLHHDGLAWTPFSAQRAAASLALEALVTAPQRQHVVTQAEQRGSYRPRVGIQVASQTNRAAASLALEALVTRPRPAIIQTLERQARLRFQTIQTSAQTIRAAASLALEALVSPPRPAVTVQATPERPARRPQTHVIAPRPALAAAVTPPPVTPPQTTHVVTRIRAARAPAQGHAQTPYASQRGAASLALEALVTRPVASATVQATPERPARRPRPQVLAPRPPLAATLAPPPVTPPQTTHVVTETRQARPQPQGHAQTPYAAQRGAASLALEALVTPPRPTLVTRTVSRPSRRSLVVAPRPILSAPPVVVTPPRTVSIVSCRPVTPAPQRIGRVIRPRPVLAPIAPPRASSLVRSVSRRRRPQAGSIYSHANLSYLSAVAAVPSLGPFSDAPQTGLGDSPQTGVYGDSAQTALQDNPTTGGWDKHL